MISPQFKLHYKYVKAYLISIPPQQQSRLVKVYFFRQTFSFSFQHNELPYYTTSTVKPIFIINGNFTLSSNITYGITYYTTKIHFFFLYPCCIPIDKTTTLLERPTKGMNQYDKRKKHKLCSFTSVLNQWYRNYFQESLIISVFSKCLKLQVNRI